MKVKCPESTLVLQNGRKGKVTPLINPALRRKEPSPSVINFRRRGGGLEVEAQSNETWE